MSSLAACKPSTARRIPWPEVRLLADKPQCWMELSGEARSREAARGFQGELLRLTDNVDEDLAKEGFYISIV
jgi:hypothetical protein